MKLLLTCGQWDVELKIPEDFFFERRFIASLKYINMSKYINRLSLTDIIHWFKKYI